MVTQRVRLRPAPGAFVRQLAGVPGLFVLDGGGRASWDSGRARIGFAPRATLRVTAGGEAEVRRDGKTRRWRGDPFSLLDRFVDLCAPSSAAAGGGGGGGVVAALSYDLRHWVEPTAGRRVPEPTLPVLFAAAHDWVLEYSYAEKVYRLVSATMPRARLKAIAAELDALAARSPETAARAPRGRPSADWSARKYESAVQAVRDYIAAGDVYQVNLTQRFSLQLGKPVEAAAAASLFATLQRRNPAPFAAFFDCGELALVSNSPECFLTRRGCALTTRPIKGTRARGSDRAADAALRHELRRDAKEAAEHVMIVDLERNDLGKICRTGSVAVTDFARVHTFRGLHHMISEVSGRLPEGTTLATVLRALFPGGSITGAPKIRAMQIIDELEPVARGFYTGAIGFVDWNGDATFNLAIRTAIVEGRRVTYHAGGGIVADSDPGRERDESLLKARPFFDAVLEEVR